MAVSMTSMATAPVAAPVRITCRAASSVRCSSVPRRVGAPKAAWTAARTAPLRTRKIQASASRFFVCASDVDVEEEMLLIEEDATERMDKCIDSAKANFGTIRTGRASPNMLDRIQVEYYGAMTDIRSVAGISVPDSTTLQIQPFDMGALTDIERAIMQSDLDLNPNNDGKIIRIRIPELTEERRKEMTKKVAALGEDAKVAIRNVRRDSLKSLSKLSDASEDMVKDMENTIQKLTDGSVKSIDDMVKSKNKELTTV